MTEKEKNFLSSSQKANKVLIKRLQNIDNNRKQAESPNYLVGAVDFYGAGLACAHCGKMLDKCQCPDNGTRNITNVPLPEEMPDNDMAPLNPSALCDPLRTLILKRIAELSLPSSEYNSGRLFEKGRKYYGWTWASFSSLTDADLLRHFECLVSYAYRQM